MGNLGLTIKQPLNLVIKKIESTGMQDSVYDPTNVQADAFDRANHHGTQTASTISDFTAAVSALVPPDAVTSVNGHTGTVTLTKSDVGLASADNTSDASKPVSTATQTALNAKEPTITAGTTSQYWRGDKSWQTLPVGLLQRQDVRRHRQRFDGRHERHSGGDNRSEGGDRCHSDCLLSRRQVPLRHDSEWQYRCRQRRAGCSLPRRRHPGLDAL